MDKKLLVIMAIIIFGGIISLVVFKQEIGEYCVETSFDCDYEKTELGYICNITLENKCLFPLLASINLNEANSGNTKKVKYG